MLDKTIYNNYRTCQKNLFHSTRIPHFEIDEIKSADIPQRHLVVIHKGKLFAVDAFDSVWNVRDEREIMGDLASILDEGKCRDTVDSVCTLTTLDRDTWAEVRISNKHSRSSIQII